MAINFDNKSKNPSNSNPFEIAHDEYVIKDYYAANIKKPAKGQARVALTNKRAIIYYRTDDGILVNDAQISQITATNIFWGQRKRITTGLIMLAIGIIGSLALMITLLPDVFNSDSYSSYDPYYDSYYYSNDSGHGCTSTVAFLSSLPQPTTAPLTAVATDLIIT